MPRETTISKVLLPLLDQYPSIDIPGLGNLGYRDLPASLDKESHTLFPPMRTLVFSTALTEENSVYDLLPDTLSKKEIKQFNNDIDFAINELINLGKTKLKGVALLERDQVGNITITNISKAARGPLQYLSTVQLSPVKQTKEVSSQPEVSPTTIAKPSVVEAPTPEATYVSPYAKSSTSSFGKVYLIPIIIGILAILAAAYFFKQCQASKSGDQSDMNSSYESSHQVGIEDSDPTDVNHLANLPAKYQDILTADILATGCTIVIGSYESRANAITRSQEVESLGYEMIEVTEDKPYRAIIKFDCSEHDLDQYMLEVRDVIEPRAWYLSPEGYDVSR